MGLDGTLFLRFLSLFDKLQALRWKRKLFPIPSKTFLDEKLTRAHVVELRHSRGLVAEARQTKK